MNPQSPRRVSAVIALIGAAVFAAAAPSSEFDAAYAAALARCGAAFARAEALDPGPILKALRPLAATIDDAGKVERLGQALKDQERLRVPVAASGGTSQDGEILDAAYKSQVLRLARELSADGPAALEARRRLLRGGVGSSVAAPAADPRRSRRDAASIADARGIGKALEQEKSPESLVAAGGPARTAKAATDGAVLRVEDFQPSRGRLKTSDVPGAEAAERESSAPKLDASWERSKLGATSVLGIGGGLVGTGGGLVLFNGGLALCGSVIFCAAGAPAMAVGAYLTVRGSFSVYLNAHNLATGKEGPSSMLQLAAEKMWPGSKRAQHVALGADLATDVALISGAPALIHAGETFAGNMPLFTRYSLYMTKEAASLGKTLEAVGWSDSIAGVSDAIFKHVYYSPEKVRERESRPHMLPPSPAVPAAARKD